MSNSAVNPYDFTDLTSLTATIACVLLGIFVLLYLWGRLTGGRRQLLVLICGPPGSGKTKLFTELAYGKTMPTVTSQQTNTAIFDLSKVCSKKDDSSRKPVEAKLVDVPGSRQLLARFLPEHVLACTNVVFMLRSLGPTAPAYAASTADCLLQLVEASLLGEKRKFGNVRLLFVIRQEDKSSANTVVQNAKELLQAEINRLTRTASSDAVPLGGAAVTRNAAETSIDSLAKRVDWLVSEDSVDNENDSALARDISDWVLNSK